MSSRDHGVGQSPALGRIVGLLSYALGALTLSACSSLLGSKGPPVDLYDLTPPNGSSAVADLREVSWHLAVERPLAPGGLADNRIAVRPAPHRLQYLAGVRWTESVPAMLQTLLIESLESSGRIAALGRQDLGFRADYRLSTELRAFEAVYSDPQEAPDVHVRLSARLLQGQRIVATAAFEERTKASGTNIVAIVDAFDRATDAVLDDVVRWTLSTPGGP